MSTSLLIVLSVAEAVVLVVVLALALIEIRRRLSSIASDRSSPYLGAARSMVEEEHLRPLRARGSKSSTRSSSCIIGLMPSVARKAAVIAEHVETRSARSHAQLF